MKLNTAITNRILEYCEKNDLSINKLAANSLLTQSTLNNIVNGHTKDIKLFTIIRICGGMGISLSEFFSHKDFENIDIDV